MKIRCPHCGARYELDETLLEESGRRVGCSACHRVFLAEKIQSPGDEAPPGDKEMEQLLAEMEETLAGLEKLGPDRAREPLPAALKNDVPPEMADLKATEVPPELLFEPGPEPDRRPSRSSLLLALLLGLLLAAQLTWLNRDRWLQQPKLRALAEHWCPYLGCTLPPVRPGALPFRVVDGRLETAGPRRYRLRLLLRNQDGDGQTLPALQVSLTDDQQKLVARRTFEAPVYAAGRHRDFAAGETLQVELLLAVPSGRVAGYEVKLLPAGA